MTVVGLRHQINPEHYVHRVDYDYQDKYKRLNKCYLRLAFEKQQASVQRKANCNHRRVLDLVVDFEFVGLQIHLQSDQHKQRDDCCHAFVRLRDLRQKHVQRYDHELLESVEELPVKTFVSVSDVNDVKVLLDGRAVQPSSVLDEIQKNQKLGSENPHYQYRYRQHESPQNVFDRISDDVEVCIHSEVACIDLDALKQSQSRVNERRQYQEQDDDIRRNEISFEVV